MAKGQPFMHSLEPLEHPNLTRNRIRQRADSLHVHFHHEHHWIIDRMVDRMTRARMPTLQSKRPWITKTDALRLIVEEYGRITGLDKEEAGLPFRQ